MVEPSTVIWSHPQEWVVMNFSYQSAEYADTSRIIPAVINRSVACIIFVSIVCECGTISLEVRTFAETVSSGVLTRLHVQGLKIISRLPLPRKTINTPCPVTHSSAKERMKQQCETCLRRSIPFPEVSGARLAPSRASPSQPTAQVGCHGFIISSGLMSGLKTWREMRNLLVLPRKQWPLGSVSTCRLLGGKKNVTDTRIITRSTEAMVHSSLQVIITEG